MGTFSQWVEEDYPQAFQYLEQALKISEKVNDDTSLWFASFFLGIARSLNCEFEKGLEYFQKSLDLGLEANNPIMIVFAKGLMSSFNYIFYGKADLAYQMSQESLQMAQESGDIYLKGMAYSSCGMASRCRSISVRFAFARKYRRSIGTASPSGKSFTTTFRHAVQCRRTRSPGTMGWPRRSSVKRSSGHSAVG